MTPAIRLLEASGVAFSIHEYERGEELKDFGREAAESLGLPFDQVFKTLVVDLDDGRGLAVAVLPVSCLLSMKLVAAAFGAKRATMADQRAAERSSGYVVGGISPLGQKRVLRTAVDESAELFDEIYVSGGRRGLDIAVAPADLVRLLDAVVAPITALTRGPAVWARQRAGWRIRASMRATRVRAGGCDAASRARQPIGRRAIALRQHEAQGTGEFGAEAHPYGQLVGLVFGRVADHVGDRVAAADRRGEHPRQPAEDRRGHGADRGDGRRPLPETPGGGLGHVLQVEPDPRQHHHRHRQPVAERDRHRVQPEVVAQLVGEHPAQLRRRQFGDRERGHHDEVAAAGERVHLVGVDHAHDVPARRKPVRFGDPGPDRFDHRRLGRRRSAGAQDRREHEHLERPHEHQQSDGEEGDGEHPVVDAEDDREREPEHRQGEQREGQHADHRDERPQCAALHPPCPLSRDHAGDRIRPDSRDLVWIGAATEPMVTSERSPPSGRRSAPGR